MVDRTDIAGIDPDLELTFGPSTLECAGTLDARTGHHVLDAVESLLQRHPANVDIDVSRLRVADADGANVLVLLERMVNEAGVNLRWSGLDAQHLSDGIAV